MHDIFLSYATNDRQRLLPLVNALEQQGWTVFWDHRSIDIGKNWYRVIDKAVRQCPCVIVAWSVDSVRSEWVEEEVLIALDRQKASPQQQVLYPIRLDAVSIPFGFSKLQSADFTGWQGETDHPAWVKLREQLALRLDSRQAGVTQTKLKPHPTPQPIYEPPGRSGSSTITGSGTSSGWGMRALAVAVVLGGGIWGGMTWLKSEPDKSAPKPLPPSPVIDPEPTPTPKRLPFEPEMVEIPGGTFLMGCDPQRDEVEGGCLDNEKPAHTVTISSFLLAKTEVTNAQYMTCVDAEGCPAPESYNTDFTGSDYPVVGVSWDDATAYVQWLSKKTGKSYRLPTEAEWEYAARANSKTAYWWGKAASHDYANYGKEDCCGGLASGKDKWVYTSPVGSFPANAFGVQDMHGNVYEWVADRYGGYAEQSVSDPQGPDKGSARVLRGGSWDSYPQALRSASRNDYAPAYRNGGIGFRPAQVKEQQ